MTLPPPPAEVPLIKSPSVLAPGFRAALQRVFVRLRHGGFDPVIAESLRTDARQRYLFGFGREYDDGRGEVTESADCAHTWHCYGLAADVISIAHGWDSEAFFEALGAAAHAERLAWGGNWHRRDLPHVQWGSPMLVSPSPRAAALRESGGVEAVWKVVGAARA